MKRNSACLAMLAFGACLLPTSVQAQVGVLDRDSRIAYSPLHFRRRDITE